MNFVGFVCVPCVQSLNEFVRYSMWYFVYRDRMPIQCVFLPKSALEKCDLNFTSVVFFSKSLTQLIKIHETYIYSESVCACVYVYDLDIQMKIMCVSIKNVRSKLIRLKY